MSAPDSRFDQLHVQVLPLHVCRSYIPKQQSLMCSAGKPFRSRSVASVCYSLQRSSFQASMKRVASKYHGETWQKQKGTAIGLLCCNTMPDRDINEISKSVQLNIIGLQKLAFFCHEQAPSRMAVMIMRCCKYVDFLINSNCKHAAIHMPCSLTGTAQGRAHRATCRTLNVNS